MRVSLREYGSAVDYFHIAAIYSHKLCIFGIYRRYPVHGYLLVQNLNKIGGTHAQELSEIEC